MPELTPMDQWRIANGQAPASATRLAKATVTKAAPQATSLGNIVATQAALAARAANQPAHMTAPPIPTANAITAAGMGPDQDFSPGTPIDPYFGVNRRPRGFNYRTGTNISTRPRTEEGRVPFHTLKSILRAYDVAQICGNHRIDDIRSLDWHIVAIDDAEGDVTADVATARKAIAKPDGRTPLASWLHKFLYDTIHFDAGCVYKQRDMKGDVIGLKVVDGTTIAPLLDYYGDVPVGDPDATDSDDEPPAYVQFANGLPWVWLADRDIYYLPFRPVADSAYGLPPLEWLLITANTDIRFQWYFLQEFTEGTIPAGFAEAPPDRDSPEQVEEWQDFWDALMEGDESKKHQVKWVPAGTKYSPVRQLEFDENFPLFLMRRTCAAYGVVPTDLGFTETANKSSSEVQVDVQFRIGTKPLLSHVEGIFNAYLHDDLGLDRIEFQFETGGEKEDMLAEAQAWQIWCEMGAASPDEPRAKILGLEVDIAHPIPRTISTRTGLVPIKSIMEVSGHLDAGTEAPIAGNVVISDAPGFVPPVPVSSPIIPAPPGGSAPPAAAAPAGPAEAAAVAKETTAGVTAATGIAGVDLKGRKPDDDADDDEEELAKALSLWRSNTRKPVAEGDAPEAFRAPGHPRPARRAGHGQPGRGHRPGRRRRGVHEGSTGRPPKSR